MILQYVTVTLDVYQVCHSVRRCVNMRVVLHVAWSESQWVGSLQQSVLAQQRELFVLLRIRVISLLSAYYIQWLK